MSAGVNPEPYGVGFSDLKRNWGWFLALGIALIILGMIALGSAFLVTLFSVLMLGWLMIVGGALTAGHAFWRKQWGSFFIDLVAGILYLIAGFMLVTNPGEGAVLLTLLIALYILIGGLLRIVIAFATRFHNWGWMLLNGIVTALLGALIIMGWPSSGLWVIGLFIGIDLIFYGWSLVMLALAVRSMPGQPTAAP